MEYSPLRFYDDKMGDFHHILKGRGGFPSGFVEVRSRRNNSSSLTSPRQRQNPARAADKLKRHHGLERQLNLHGLVAVPGNLKS